MSTIIGTSHFSSFNHAVRYYEGYGYENPKAAVQRKIDEGEIHIGPPTTPHTFYLDVDGRYMIEEPSSPAKPIQPFVAPAYWD